MFALIGVGGGVGGGGGGLGGPSKYKLQKRFVKVQTDKLSKLKKCEKERRRSKFWSFCDNLIIECS